MEDDNESSEFDAKVSDSNSDKPEYKPKKLASITKKNDGNNSSADSSADDSSGIHDKKFYKTNIKSSSRKLMEKGGIESSENDSSASSDLDGKKVMLKSKKFSKRSPKNRNEHSSRDENLSDSDNSRAKSPATSSEDEISMETSDKKYHKSNVGKQEKKQSRKSKENAMREIYSESSRMLRQSAVGLPYHRPKQRTLDEFLNRKKILHDVLPVLGGIKIR